MFALVSGQTGLAIFVGGDSATVLRFDEEKEERYAVGSVGYLLAGATDVIELQEPTRAKARSILKEKWSLDRASRLFLLAADASESDNDVREALDCIETLLTPNVFEELLIRLCTAPFPSESNLGRTLRLAADNSRGSELASEVAKMQPAIRKVWAAWESISDRMLSREDAERFLRTAAGRGIFARLALATGGQRINETIFDAYRSLAGHKNSRSVVSAWIKAIGLTSVRHTNKPRGDEGADEQEGRVERNPLHTRVHEVFSNVDAQLRAIEERLDKGDEGRARDYAIELIDQQIAQGSANYAAKSLCRLAQRAKIRGFRSLCLNWTERATQVAPEDGWAHGQLADAYLYYGRLDEAQAEFDQSYNLGERYFGLMGSIRIQVARGDFTEALSKIRKIKAEFAKDHEGHISWVHEAEILRQMWLLEEALAVYDDAVSKFPNQRIVYCGKAAVLANLGRQREAIEVYSTCIDLLGPDVVSLSGRAQALLEIGLFQEAIAEYQKAIVTFPDDSQVPTCGLAEVYRMQGHYEDALKAYRAARKNFPFSPVPYSGYAEVLKDMERYDESLSEFDTALQTFPLEMRLWNGRARVLRLKGNFEDALAAYDQAVSRFPYDLFSQTGRALLLRELGRLDDAIAVYERIISQRPGFLAARVGKASVLVAQKRYSEARALLPPEQPRTADEWIAHHVRGMILLRTNSIGDAIKLFEDAVRSVPYFFARCYFQNALAVARLRLEEYEGALEDATKGSSGAENKVLVFHALAALRRDPDAIHMYRMLTSGNSPHHIIVLRDEIAARFGLTGKPKHEPTWLFERECEAQLLAVAA